MKSHLQRLKEQEAETKEQKLKNIRMGRLLMVFALLSFAAFSFFTIISTIEPDDSAKANIAEDNAMQEITEKDLWELIIVNRQVPLPREFTVDLIKFQNIRVDYRISEPLQKMIEAANGDGVNISVCSGFRSVTEQDALYNTKCLKYEAEGYSDEAGEILASQYLQTGGTSEHHTGLAVDLTTDETAELDESFAKTTAYTWLKENASKFGFIERYPKDKSQLTGILWEPWHYRYVGESNAFAIMSKNLCLEEYLQSVGVKS